MVNVGREAMMAIGCIQAQKCHTDHCPVGVATQNPRYTLRPRRRRSRACGPPTTSGSLRRDLLKVSEAVGVVHPGLITPWDIDILTGQRSTQSLHDVYGYDDDWGAIGPDLRATIEKTMTSQGEAPEPRPTTR